MTSQEIIACGTEECAVELLVALNDYFGPLAYGYKQDSWTVYVEWVRDTNISSRLIAFAVAFKRGYHCGFDAKKGL